MVGSSVDLVRQSWQSPKVLEPEALELIRKLGKPKERSVHPAVGVGIRRLGGRRRRRLYKTTKYRVHQELFRNNPAELAVRVLDGVKHKECHLPIERFITNSVAGGAKKDHFYA